MTACECARWAAAAFVCEGGNARACGRYPTRTARFGTAMVPSGLIKLRHSALATDLRPLDDTCSCFVCKRWESTQFPLPSPPAR